MSQTFAAQQVGDEKIIYPGRRKQSQDDSALFFENAATQVSTNAKSGEYIQKLLPSQDSMTVSQRRLKGLEAHILKKSRDKFKLLQIM